MCTYKKFCGCCCNVVTCSRVIASLRLTTGPIYLILGLLGFFGRVNSWNFHSDVITTFLSTYAITPAFHWINIILNVMFIILNALMLYGINTRKPGYMMAWLIVEMIYLVLLTIISVLVICYAILMESTYDSQEAFIPMIIFWTVGLAVWNGLGYYIWDIVKSAYKQIKEENQANQHAIPCWMMNNHDQKPPSYHV